MDGRPDAPEKNQSQTLLQLGERALAQLALEARAAQIEAQRAELELLMVRARQGDVTSLQQWLKINGKYTESDTLPASSDELSSWLSIQAFSVARLKQREASNSKLAHSARPVPTSNFADVRVDATHRNVTSDVLVKVNHGDSATGEAEPRGPKSTSSRLALTNETFDSKKVDKADLEIPKELDWDLPETRDDSQWKPVVEVDELMTTPSDAPSSHNQHRKWKGVAFSAVFHTAILIALAITTMDTPVKNGLLSFVSGEVEATSEIDNFEMNVTDAVEQPEASSDVVEPTSTQPNFAEAIQGPGLSLTEALSQPAISSSGSSQGKSNLMASKSGMSKSAVSFYGAESTGNSFCFVLDGSGSMRGGPWEAARIELLRSIGSLKPTQRFYIIFFNKEVMAIVEPGKSQPASRALLATPDNIAHAKRWLDTLQISTGEPPMKALEAALEVECDCVYFLADGEMSDSVAKRLLEFLRKKNRANDIINGEVVLTPIHTIAYYSDKGLEIMRRVAEENRGQFAYVPKPKTAKGGK